MKWLSGRRGGPSSALGVVRANACGLSTGTAFTLLLTSWGSLSMRCPLLAGEDEERCAGVAVESGGVFKWPEGVVSG